MTSSSSGFGALFGSAFGSGPWHCEKIIDDAMRAASIETTSVDYRLKVLTFLNSVYQLALQGRRWRFMNYEQAIEMIPPYEVGGVTVTQDSDIVSEYDLSGGPVIQFKSLMAGQLFCPTRSDQEAYRIHRVDGNKKLQLTAAYTGSTYNGARYKILTDRYELPSNLSEVRSIFLATVGELKLVPREHFLNMKESNPTTEGPPRYATHFSTERDSGQQVYEVFPAPDKRYAGQVKATLRIDRLEDSETSFPVIPPDHYPVLHFGLLSEIYRDRNNNAMLQDARDKALKAWNNMVGDQRVEDSKPRIQHGKNHGNRRYRSSYYATRNFARNDE